MKDFSFLHFGALTIISRALIAGALRPFPPDFQFGVATSAYQIEGAWNLGEKGENIWDRLVHTTSLVEDGSTGDIACDSVRQYKTDVGMISDLGVDFYRFSLSWSRILPTGHSNVVSLAGIAYYNSLIDELIANGIRPVVTLFHWDLPQTLQDFGGWTNPLMVDYFEDFAKVAFDAFGDRVKTWVTINEPISICLEGYGLDSKAPAINQTGVGEYLCGHTILKAHARVYHLYNDAYRAQQKGRISISLNSYWSEPKDNSTENVQAAERLQQFELGWFAHPIFSSTGDYPDVMKQYIAARSSEQGFSRSRLPRFSPEEVQHIKGTYDFFGLNHYTTKMSKQPARTPATRLKPTYEDDFRVDTYFMDEWPSSASPWLKVVPWGFRKLLNWIRESYNNPEIQILENGYSDRGELDDQDRINYYKLYLEAMQDAMDDGCDVSTYTAWSLMDNFEWLEGYGAHFGLYAVDHNDPDRRRTAKSSVAFFKDVTSKKSV